MQPHSGAQANAAVFAALVSPGDTIMGMSLAHGGHLTHGHPANFSGKNYKVVAYGLDPATGLINYDEMQNAGTGAQAEDAHRRLLRLFADQGLGAHARHRR